MVIFSAIVVDDDKLTRTRTKTLLEQTEIVTILGDYDDGHTAIDNINKLKPDVVFLDTKINGTNGFEIIDSTTLSKKPLFIFIANSGEYAAKAFDYFIFDYLLKPLDKKRFSKTINNIIEFKKKNELANFNHSLENILNMFQENKTPNNKNPLIGRKINIKSGNKIIFLDLNSIKYISASGYYVEIFTSDSRKFLLRESLSSIIKRLNSNEFVRIHRSTVINSNFIDEVITSNYGETDVKISDNKTFRISKGYKKGFQKIMGVK